MNSSDEKLNQLLNSVAPVPSNSNLAERIIAQAEIPDINVNKESFLKQVLRSLIFPKPAYALACSMLVGVLLGWQNPEVNTNINTIQVASADEELSSLFLAEVNFDE
ncbi:MAG: hypothetical protein JKY50_15735 [Oleispira sp.]|nr:hypothetical protein [Oleispira sp.]MBL4882629.1 hypothetical protein [Oleispira sp.]